MGNKHPTLGFLKDIEEKEDKLDFKHCENTLCLDFLYVPENGKDIVFNHEISGVHYIGFIGFGKIIKCKGGYISKRNSHRTYYEFAIDIPLTDEEYKGLFNKSHKVNLLFFSEQKEFIYTGEVEITFPDEDLFLEMKKEKIYLSLFYKKEKNTESQEKVTFDVYINFFGNVFLDFFDFKSPKYNLEKFKHFTIRLKDRNSFRETILQFYEKFLEKATNLLSGLVESRDDNLKKKLINYDFKQILFNIQDNCYKGYQKQRNFIDYKLIYHPYFIIELASYKTKIHWYDLESTEFENYFIDIFYCVFGKNLIYNQFDFLEKFLSNKYFDRSLAIVTDLSHFTQILDIISKSPDFKMINEYLRNQKFKEFLYDNRDFIIKNFENKEVSEQYNNPKKYFANLLNALRIEFEPNTDLISELFESKSGNIIESHEILNNLLEFLNDQSSKLDFAYNKVFNETQKVEYHSMLMSKLKNLVNEEDQGKINKFLNEYFMGIFSHLINKKNVYYSTAYHVSQEEITLLGHPKLLKLENFYLDILYTNNKEVLKTQLIDNNDSTGDLYLKKFIIGLFNRYYIDNFRKCLYEIIFEDQILAKEAIAFLSDKDNIPLLFPVQTYSYQLNLIKSLKENKSIMTVLENNAAYFKEYLENSQNKQLQKVCESLYPEYYSLQRLRFKPLRFFHKQYPPENYELYKNNTYSGYKNPKSLLDSSVSFHGTQFIPCLVGMLNDEEFYPTHIFVGQANEYSENRCQEILFLSGTGEYPTREEVNHFKKMKYSDYETFDYGRFNFLGLIKYEKEHPNQLKLNKVKNHQKAKYLLVIFLKFFYNKSSKNDNKSEISTNSEVGAEIGITEDLEDDGLERNYSSGCIGCYGTLVEDDAPKILAKDYLLMTEALPLPRSSLKYDL